MWWVNGILSVVVIVATLVVRSHLQDIDNDY